MKVLFATGNPAKVKRYKESLEKNGIELITIKDIGINLNIDENGKDAIENAYIKAKAYYDATGIPTIGMDNNLFIDGIDESLQPGTHVRRVGGRQLSDEEMITYYTRLVKEHGGKLQAKWVYGMVVITDKSCDELTWSKDKFYFVSTPCSKRNPGYPLDSISIIPEFNKYLVELSDEERNLYKSKENIDRVVNFILDCINKSKEI
ncbi:hAM1/NUDIX domain-containing protein [Clostridium sp. CAG:1219]|nr:hAM1/NUDIX domain-containing protein [Clostridium sp. CAG:1219]